MNVARRSSLPILLATPSHGLYSDTRKANLGGYATIRHVEIMVWPEFVDFQLKL